MQGDKPLVGQVIGNYEILRELGRGGMGVVYKAHETSLNRMVALKVLPAYLATDQAFLNRFVREARAAASLIHPNVVTIHAVGEDGGTHFIAMEYVKGQTLSQLIRQSGTIHPERALQIILDAADALAMAHKRGIIHRDIKPQNIMIDEAGRVKVMDFGLARAVTSESNLTADGAMIGTPMYMSPEQCEGKKADHRSDIYALGVVLYEMLTGRTPYDATTPLAIMRQIVDRPFPDAHQLSPVVSPEVNRILQRMVAKDIADRYQSIEEVRRDIHAALKSTAGRAAIHEEKTVTVDEAATEIETPAAASVSQLETVLSPVPQTPPPAQPGAGATATDGGHRSAVLIGVVAALATALVMLMGFLLLQRSDSPPPTGSTSPAAVAVVPSNPKPPPESGPAPAANAVSDGLDEEDVVNARREADDLARRADEAALAEAEREAAERAAQKRAEEQAALLAAAEEASQRAAAVDAAAALAELERKKREAEEALAQLEAERAAREALEREAAALRAAEEEARRKAAELERRQREAEAARVVSASTAEQQAAKEAAARRAAEQEAARKAAAAEAARKAAAEEAARKAAEEEAARMAAAAAAKPAYPDIAGRWRADGKLPDAEDRGRSLDPATAVHLDGANARIQIGGIELAGQYVNGRLTAKYETTISAIGRSGKGRSQVPQVWEIDLKAVSANRLEGTFSVTHSGFQASEAHKNGTRSQTCVLTR